MAQSSPPAADVLKQGFLTKQGKLFIIDGRFQCLAYYKRSMALCTRDFQQKYVTA